MAKQHNQFMYGRYDEGCIKFIRMSEPGKPDYVVPVRTSRYIAPVKVLLVDVASRKQHKWITVLNSHTRVFDMKQLYGGHTQRIADWIENGRG